SKGQLRSASGSDGAQRSRMPGLLARLFGVGGDEAQDAATAAAPAPVKVAAISRKPAAAPEARVEKPSAAAESRNQKGAKAPLPAAKPAQAGGAFAPGGGEAGRQAGPDLRGRLRRVRACAHPGWL